MPLRHTSVTLKSLAARRRNALKSTGPRTARGKARVCLNALKDGQHAVLAARAPRLRQRLIDAGQLEEEAVYGAIRSRIAQASPIQGPAARKEIDRLALLAWCQAWRTHPVKSKLESPLDSAASNFWVPTHCGFNRQRFSIIDPWRRAGLVFWRQRRHQVVTNPASRNQGGGKSTVDSRQSTVDSQPMEIFGPFETKDQKTEAAKTSCQKWAESYDRGTKDFDWRPGSTNPAVESSNKVLGTALEPPATPLHQHPERADVPPWVYEGAIRCRLYRLAKPGALERDRYKVLPDGNPDPTLQPGKHFKGNEGATWPGSKESWTVPPHRAAWPCARTESSVTERTEGT